VVGEEEEEDEKVDAGEVVEKGEAGELVGEEEEEDEKEDAGEVVGEEEGEDAGEVLAKMRRGAERGGAGQKGGKGGGSRRRAGGRQGAGGRQSSGSRGEGCCRWVLRGVLPVCAAGGVAGVCRGGC
jgi:hypothetical protein